MQIETGGDSAPEQGNYWLFSLSPEGSRGGDGRRVKWGQRADRTLGTI